MAPKRRRDAVTKEITKTYTFGRSQIDGTDVSSLVKNRMVGTARAPGRETVPRPRDDEVVIFRDLLYAGLRFPLHPAVVDILQYFDIYLHQITPMKFFGCQCTCGYAAPRRSSIPPRDLLRRIKSTTSAGQSSKKKGISLSRKTVNLAV
jgi:hypothetical protein